jgi:hypothetical protein
VLFLFLAAFFVTEVATRGVDSSLSVAAIWFVVIVEPVAIGHFSKRSQGKIGHQYMNMIATTQVAVVLYTSQHAVIAATIWRIFSFVIKMLSRYYSTNYR